MSDPFELELTGIAHGGAAVGRHDGRVIFVPYGLPGERIRAQITQVKDRFAYARIVEIITASPDRVAPPCQHFGPGLCGGCHWQHVAYDRQLEYKREIVIDQLERIGKIRAPLVHPTRPSPSPWGYRHQMTFTVTPEGSTGFWSDDNSRVVPIERCHILRPSLADVYDRIDLASLDVSRIRFQCGSDSEDRMVILELEGDDPPEVEVDFPLSINALTADNEPANLIGSAHVTYHMRGRDFRVTAGGFFQVNPSMADALVEEALARLVLKGDETVLDLYSGVGLFTAFIAERCGLVISVESFPPAVTDAEANLAELDNVEIIEGSVEAVLGNLSERIDAVVADPPRAGLGNAVVEKLVRLKPARIVYVSCDPATFARDCGRFAQLGYRLIDVQPLDMFPQTFHIECVATLEQAL